MTIRNSNGLTFFGWLASIRPRPRRFRRPHIQDNPEMWAATFGIGGVVTTLINIVLAGISTSIDSWWVWVNLAFVALGIVSVLYSCFLDTVERDWDRRRR